MSRRWYSPRCPLVHILSNHFTFRSNPVRSNAGSGSLILGSPHPDAAVTRAIRAPELFQRVRSVRNSPSVTARPPARPQHAHGPFQMPPHSRQLGPRIGAFKLAAFCPPRQYHMQIAAGTAGNLSPNGRRYGRGNKARKARQNKKKEEKRKGRKKKEK